LAFIRDSSQTFYSVYSTNEWIYINNIYYTVLWHKKKMKSCAYELVALTFITKLHKATTAWLQENLNTYIQINIKYIKTVYFVTFLIFYTKYVSLNCFWTWLNMYDVLLKNSNKSLEWREKLVNVSFINTNYNVK